MSNVIETARKTPVTYRAAGTEKCGQLLILYNRGAKIVALDAAFRKRPDGILTKDLVDRIHEAGRLAMADCLIFEECQAPQKMGFDIVSTALSGYTEYSPNLEGPDFELIRRCSEQLSVPVIAEGRIRCPEELKKAFECGAFSAVVGGAITRLQEITARFVRILG